MARWVVLVVALAFPAATLTVVTTAGGFAAQAIAAVSQEAATAGRPPTHHKAKAKAKPKAPSRTARADIPAHYLALYRQAGHTYRLPWSVLAGIGKIESDHGRSHAPGVRSGVNRFGCCAGPMQFNLRNGPPSTWDIYGRGNVYDPGDAIPAAARLLIADGARRDLAGAIYAYNHSRAYVARVLDWAHRYAR